ncbi:hypothetical protein EB118_25600 [bacterium]|nr:hypothetical protein [bacterium]
MDKVIYVIDGFGEYGLDVDHSPGVGGYYVKLYDGSYDASGFYNEKDAREELEFLVSISSHSVWHHVDRGIKDDPHFNAGFDNYRDVA